MPVTPRVPIQTPMFDSQGLLTRTWIIFFERLGSGYWLEQTAGGGGGATIVGFDINDATPGINVGPMLVSPDAGSVTQCVVVVKVSDPGVNLAFDIRKNGTSVFSATPSIPMGAATGSVHTVGTLASGDIAESDAFSIDITSGSDQWAFTAQLEE